MTNMETVLISGGTGLIGRKLANTLLSKGYQVRFLTRSVKQFDQISSFQWNPLKGEIDENALNNVDYIIHLAGENIGAKRWTKKRKKSILDSRVKSAELLYNQVKTNNIQLKAFITASAIGYYGAITSDKIYSEEDLPYNDFMGNICKSWEEAADHFDKIGIRTVKLRSGVVLAKDDGILARMSTPIKLGIGSSLGSGKQYIPWIHVDDLIEIYIQAIEDSKMNGAYNAVAPEHQTNESFTKILALALGKKLWMPNVPSFVLKLIFGEMSDMILKGSRVSSDKIINASFAFEHPKLKEALHDILCKK